MRGREEDRRGKDKGRRGREEGRERETRGRERKEKNRKGREGKHNGREGKICFHINLVNLIWGKWPSLLIDKSKVVSWPKAMLNDFTGFKIRYIYFYLSFTLWFLNLLFFCPFYWIILIKVHLPYFSLLILFV